MIEEMIKYPLAPENLIVWLMILFFVLVTPLVIYDNRKKIKWYCGLIVHILFAIIKAIKEDALEKKQKLWH